MSDPASDQTPSDRATTFQAVQGNQPEHYSGEVLLVSAYSLVFVILLIWVAISWKKVTELRIRLDDLERAIGAAPPKSRDAARNGPSERPRAP
jgi:hypothetical protein